METIGRNSGILIKLEIMETLQNAKETKARKQHSCNWCYGKIIQGENYMKSTHVNEGEIYDWKAHTYCDKMVGVMNMFEHADIYEGLNGEDFQEIISQKYKDVLIEGMPEDYRVKYIELIKQLNYVNFKHRLWTVIRHFNIKGLTAIETAQ